MCILHVHNSGLLLQYSYKNIASCGLAGDGVSYLSVDDKVCWNSLQTVWASVFSSRQAMDFSLYLGDAFSVQFVDSPTFNKSYNNYNNTIEIYRQLIQLNADIIQIYVRIASNMRKCAQRVK